VWRIGKVGGWGGGNCIVQKCAQHFSLAGRKKTAEFLCFTSALEISLIIRTAT